MVVGAVEAVSPAMLAKSRERFGASGAEHQSRLRRRTVFDGSRHDLAGGLVNKFPVRRQGHAPRFAPFAWPDTKPSRKVTKTLARQRELSTNLQSSLFTNRKCLLFGIGGIEDL